MLKSADTVAPLVAEKVIKKIRKKQMTNDTSKEFLVVHNVDNISNYD